MSYHYKGVCGEQGTDKFTINGEDYSNLNGYEFTYHNDFKTIKGPYIEDQTRWCTIHCVIVEHVKTGGLYEIVYETPSTESCDGSQVDGFEFKEVVPKKVYRTVYVPRTRERSV